MSGCRSEFFGEEEAGGTGRIAFESSEDGVAEALVEAAGLEAEGIEPDAGAATLDGFFFGEGHDPGAQACAAQGFRQEEQVDVEEGEGCSAPQAAEDLAGFGMGEDDDEEAEVVGQAGANGVELTNQDGERPGDAFARCLGEFNVGNHSCAV
jgi:hypothetical protein